MCTVSDKIKFCTCSVKDISKLDNYWILHRKNKGKKKAIMYIGEPSLSYTHKLPEFKINNTILCNRLNESDAFDKIIEFKEDDELEVVFNSKDSRNIIEHYFIYFECTWFISQNFKFDLMANFKTIESGNIENAFTL